MEKKQNNQVCRNYQFTGACKYGENCKFLHQIDPNQNQQNKQHLEDQSKSKTQEHQITNLLNEKLVFDNQQQQQQQQLQGSLPSQTTKPVASQKQQQQQMEEEEEFSLLELIDVKLLNSIFQSNVEKQIQSGFKGVMKFIKANKPNLINFKDMLIKYFKIPKETQFLQSAVENLPNIIKANTDIQINSLFFKSIIFIIKDNLKKLNISEELLNKIQSQWTNIPVEVYRDFFQIFNMKDFPNCPQMLNYIDSLIATKQQEKASKILMTQKLEGNQVQLLLIKLIKSMCTNKLAQQAANLVKYFNKDPNEFPELLQRLEKSCIRFYLTEYEWYFLEEQFIFRPQMQAYIVEDLVFQKKNNEAYSICKRNQLLEKKFIQKEEVIKLFTTQTNQLQYLENPMYQLDDYNPHEENMKLAPKGAYLNLLSEKQIFFLDNEKTDIYKQCIKELKSAQEIGIDTEFTPKFTKLDPDTSILCLIQLGIFDQAAQMYKAYLFDAAKIFSTKNQVMLNDLIEIMGMQTLKIGLGFNSDISQLKVFFEGKNYAIKNYIEMQSIFKILYPNETKSSLLFLVEKVLNKELSKMEQMSNWMKRPLRKSQQVYAGMDAISLIEICKQLKSNFGLQFTEELMNQQKLTFYSQVQDNPKMAKQLYRPKNKNSNIDNDKKDSNTDDEDNKDEEQNKEELEEEQKQNKNNEQ